MDELPKKVKYIDIVRIEYGRKKICDCIPPHYEIDYKNRLVLCTDCGAVMDPFDALYRMALRYESINSQLDMVQRQAEELKNYQPRRRVLKELEWRMSRGENTMVPSCPHCHEPFELEELLATTWINKQYIRRMK